MHHGAASSSLTPVPPTPSPPRTPSPRLRLRRAATPIARRRERKGCKASKAEQLMQPYIDAMLDAATAQALANAQQAYVSAALPSLAALKMARADFAAHDAVVKRCIEIRKRL